MTLDIDQNPDTQERVIRAVRQISKAVKARGMFRFAYRYKGTEASLSVILDDEDWRCRDVWAALRMGKAGTTEIEGNAGAGANLLLVTGVFSPANVPYIAAANSPLTDSAGTVLQNTLNNVAAQVYVDRADVGKLKLYIANAAGASREVWITIVGGYSEFPKSYTAVGNGL
jgi:hypothetical protein